MATFENAVAKTILWEGGYSNNPQDPGGETYEGISRVNWPSWDGWVFIDRLKCSPNFPTCLNNPTMAISVANFYRNNFWQYNGLLNQDVANKIFDLGVNLGKATSVRLAQRAANVSEDGIYGPDTENAINAMGDSADSALINQADQYYQTLVQEHPEDAVFLSGWLRRANS